MLALYDGFVDIAGQFPPSLNTETDPTTLKMFESPSVYGVDHQKENRLKTGSCPTGTPMAQVTKTVRGSTWYWFYNRLWQASGATLYFCPPYYDNLILPHGVGKISEDANIITFFPVFNTDLIVITATGSHILANAIRQDETVVPGLFLQDFYTSNATYACTLGGQPYVSNAAGVFTYDGREVKELTRNVRDSLGSFTNVAIKADYVKNLIIGTSKFVIDAETGKLFDYGTSGFLFTSRTLAQAPMYSPFRVDAIAISLEHSGTTGGTISWASKSEDGSWVTEPDIVVRYTDGQYTRIETAITNPIKACHKFAVKLTALASNLYIRSISVCVQGLATEAPSK